MAPAGTASPLPSASSRGSAGAGEGPGAAVGGFDPHLLEAGGEGGRRGQWAEAGAGRRRREGWSAPPSLALGVLTVPKLKLSAAASAGKLRGARGPRTKLEKSKQAAAAGSPPSFPLPLTLLRAVALLLPSSSSGGWGGGSKASLSRAAIATNFCIAPVLSFSPCPLPALCRPW